MSKKSLFFTARYVALEGSFRRRKPPHNGCGIPSTWFYIAAILIGTVLFNVPMMLERETVETATGLEVIPTALRFNDVYIKLYRLTMEFLVFKATPFFSFFILALGRKDRIKYYLSKVSKGKSIF